MSMMLLNPTNEDFNDMMFGGKGMPIKAGGKLKVDDNCGKHLINNYAIRGLCALDYGDDEAVIAADGVRRNLEFKRRMLGQYNYRNVTRKQQGLPWTPPSADVTRYSQELGIPLDDPYASRDREQGRLAVLEDSVARMEKMFGELLSRTLKEEEEVVAPAPKVAAIKEKAK